MSRESRIFVTANGNECEFVETVEIDTYYVAFCMSIAWLSGGGFGRDLMSVNQRCNALSTCGRKDSRLRFIFSTLPASTISLSLFLCFFHVDKVEWLIAYFLHILTPLTPRSNSLRILIFSSNVRSVCDRFMLNCTVQHRNHIWESNYYNKFIYSLKYGFISQNTISE